MNHRKFFALANSLLLIALVSVSASSGATVKPKYPADVKPLSLDHSFVQKNAALDYWKLNGFLVRQISDSACSLAAVTIVLNAVRGSENLDQGERILSQSAVLKTTNRLDWSSATASGGGGVSLRDLESIATTAFEKHGLEPKIERVSVDQIDGELRRLREDLRENERNSSTYIIVNFDQSAVMDDADPAGHFAAVGAYDGAADRVLIMDPDKDWFEPYWVPTQRLFEAMGKSRGYLKLKF